MKKQFTIFLVLVFVLGLVPVNFSLAVIQNQVDAEVQIVCTDGNDNWVSGSGTIIDPNGIILTNKHVIERAYKNTCLVGFIRSISQDPDFGTEGNYNLAEVKYYTTSSDMDAAILYLDNPTNKTYPYINIWNSNSDNLQLGEKIEVIGFPSIGGSTLTYSSGDFSGFGSILNDTQNYFKTTAPLEHGNSGGAAYSSKGEFVGIPTMVVAGELNSLSYVLSINNIKKWLSGNLGANYQDKIESQGAVIENKELSVINDLVAPNIDDMRFNVNIWSDKNKTETYNFASRQYDDEVYIGWPTAKDESGIKGYYVYWGLNINANPLIDGKFQSYRYFTGKSPSYNTYYFIIQAQDNAGNLSEKLTFPYYYGVLPDFIINDPVQYGIVTNRPNNFYIYDYSNGSKGILLKTIMLDPKKVQMISVPSNNLYIEWDGINNKNFITKVMAYFDKGADFTHCKAGGSFISCINALYREVNKDYIIKTNMDVNIGYNLEIEQYYSYGEKKDILSGSFNIVSVKPTQYKKFNQSGLSKKLIGRILLQIESRGEAYYVYPKDSKKYYMANGDEAYKIMRFLGAGITNKDLNKIKSDKNFAKKNSGKIFLQVEANGEAYYIDFNGNAHYLKDGSAAYTIMRELGLGITNNDLSKISEGSL